MRVVLDRGVGHEVEGEDPNLRRVEGGDAGLGERGHADRRGARRHEVRLVVAAALEEGSADHGVAAHVGDAVHLPDGAHGDLTQAGVERVVGRVELTRVEGHVGGEQAHEPVDHHDVAHADAFLEAPRGGREDEGLHAELDEHLDLEPHHPGHVAVVRGLVEVDAPLEGDDGLAVDVPAHDLTVVAREGAHVGEVEAGQVPHRDAGDALLPGERLAPAGTEHDTDLRRLDAIQAELFDQGRSRLGGEAFRCTITHSKRDSFRPEWTGRA